MKLLPAIIASLILLFGCKSNEGDIEDLKMKESPLAPNDHWIDYLNDHLNEAILQDGFSPPVAARIYAYCNLAAYEAYFLNEKEFNINTSEILNNYSFSTTDIKTENFDQNLTMITAFAQVSYKLVYRDFIIDDLLDSCLMYFEGALTQEVYDNSIMNGKIVADQIIQYSKEDNYDETRGFPLYDLSDEPYAWRPTPPTYGTPIEPHWGKIRLFIDMDLSEVEIAPMVPFDSVYNSDFYNLNEEIYFAVLEATEEEKQIAMHWDGDPMPPYRRLNHVNLIKRQLNPIGHFLAIGKTLSHQLNQDESQAVTAYLKIALACSDAMVICWMKKYENNLLRPHTYILKYIDELWDPILTTPLFPEYPSGHSCLAGSAVNVMIELFSDTISFTDSNLIAYGIPPRHYVNLSHAAEECAYSRVYGGIHYMPAVTEGLKVGEAIARNHSLQFQQFEKN